MFIILAIEKKFSINSHKSLQEKFVKTQMALTKIEVSSVTVYEQQTPDVVPMLD